MFSARAVTNFTLDIDQPWRFEKVDKPPWHPETCDVTAHAGCIELPSLPFENLDGMGMVRSRPRIKLGLMASRTIGGTDEVGGSA